jgi:cytochrome c551/c552
MPYASWLCGCSDALGSLPKKQLIFEQKEFVFCWAAAVRAIGPIVQKFGKLATAVVTLAGKTRSAHPLPKEVKE